MLKNKQWAQKTISENEAYIKGMRENIAEGHYAESSAECITALQEQIKEAKLILAA